MDDLKKGISAINNNEINYEVRRLNAVGTTPNANHNSSENLLISMEKKYGKIDDSSVDNFIKSVDKNIDNFLNSSENNFEPEKSKTINSEENQYYLVRENTNKNNSDTHNGKGNQQMNDVTDIENTDGTSRQIRKFAVRSAEGETSTARGDGLAQAGFRPDNDASKKRTNEAAGMDISREEPADKKVVDSEDYDRDSAPANVARTRVGPAVNVAPAATRTDAAFVFGNSARATPAPTVNVKDDRVLVPSGTGINDSMEYKTLGQYKKDRPDLSGQALKDDLDQKAILIKSEAGTYLPKNQVYKTTAVDTSKDRASQTVERNETFKKHMDELGLSDKNFAQINPKTPEFERYLDVPGGGKRLKAFNLEHPEQAGQNSPDMLLRDGDNFKAYWLNKNSVQKSPKDLEATGFARENIMLKTTGNSYLPVDTYNARLGNGAAEKQIAKLTETVLNNERPDKDLKTGFYKVDDGVYFSKEKFAAEKPEADRSKTEALFQGPSGHSLVTDKTLKFLDPKGAAEKLAAEGVPNGVKVPMNVNKPDVLVRVDNETLISGERAAILIKGKPLDQVFPASDIYIQNIGKNGKPTGNYADKESFERNNPKGQVYDRLVSAGITEKDQSAVKLAEAFSSINLGRTLNQPSTLKTNQLDDRSRGRDGRG
jgi:hypothetical protein